MEMGWRVGDFKIWSMFEFPMVFNCNHLRLQGLEAQTFRIDSTQWLKTSALLFQNMIQLPDILDRTGGIAHDLLIQKIWPMSYALLPRKLTWNPKWRFRRWCSFSNWWFSGSMFVCGFYRGRFTSGYLLAIVECYRALNPLRDSHSFRRVLGLSQNLLSRFFMIHFIKCLCVLPPWN